MKELLPNKFVDYLKKEPETKMGYHIVLIKTKDGKSYKNVLIENCSYIAGIYGYEKIPFAVKDINKIRVMKIEKLKDFDSCKWLIF